MKVPKTWCRSDWSTYKYIVCVKQLPRCFETGKLARNLIVCGLLSSFTVSIINYKCVAFLIWHFYNYFHRFQGAFSTTSLMVFYIFHQTIFSIVGAFYVLHCDLMVGHVHHRYRSLLDFWSTISDIGWELPASANLL